MSNKVWETRRKRVRVMTAVRKVLRDPRQMIRVGDLVVIGCEHPTFEVAEREGAWWR